MKQLLPGILIGLLIAAAVACGIPDHTHEPEDVKQTNSNDNTAACNCPKPTVEAKFFELDETSGIDGAKMGKVDKQCELVGVSPDKILSISRYLNGSLDAIRAHVYEGKMYTACAAKSVRVVLSMP